MPFIGRYPKYPIFPQFGPDPSMTNVMAVSYEHEAFTPGQVLTYQFKTADADIRVYDLIVEFIEGEIDFTILEGVTCTDGVTQVFAGSADRNSSFVSSVYASTDPTGISGGIPLRAFEHFGLPSPIIGFADVPPQIVNYITMKRNTNYIFKFENVSSDTIIDFRCLILFAE